jgi:hypothetical protein
MIGETVLAVGTHALQLADGTPSVTEPVLEIVLLAGKLDQLDATHAVIGQCDAIGVRSIPRVHHQSRAPGGRAQRRDRPGQHEEGSECQRSR